MRGRQLITLLAVVAFLAVGALVAVAVGLVGDNDSDPGRPGEPNPPGDTTSTTVPDDEQARPTGTVTPTGATDSTCPTGQTCEGFSVECPEVAEPADAFVSIGAAEADPRGVIVFFSGGGGTAWWSGRSSEAEPWQEDLRQEGFEIVQVRWVEPWMTAAEGEQAGMGRLSCRSATMVRWAHDTRYEPLGLAREPGICGFCVTGNSGGASQTGYSLSFYGLDDIMAAALFTGGPPHAAIAKGCLRRPGEEAYWYENSSAMDVDSSYGFVNSRSGPCLNHDTSFTDKWVADSIETGGTDYVHPETRLEFLLGTMDGSVAPDHAEDYAARLQTEQTPQLTVENVAGMRHVIERSQSGLEALKAAILGEP